MGGNIDTQRSMLHCTIYVAMHNKPEGRSSQGPSCPSAASRMPPPDMKRPGAGPARDRTTELDDIGFFAAVVSGIPSPVEAHHEALSHAALLHGFTRASGQSGDQTGCDGSHFKSIAGGKDGRKPSSRICLGRVSNGV